MLRQSLQRHRSFYRALLCAAIMCGICHILIGGTPFYYATASRARLVDATGRPVPDGVVVVVWYLRDTFGTSAIHYRAETSSGKDGVFLIPALPLRPRLPFHWIPPNDPTLYVYKPGFYMEVLDNRSDTRGGSPFHPRRASVFAGTAIRLRHAVNLDDEVAALSSLRNIATGPEALERSKFPKVWKGMEDGYRRVPNPRAYGISSPTDADGE